MTNLDETSWPLMWESICETCMCRVIIVLVTVCVINVQYSVVCVVMAIDLKLKYYSMSMTVLLAMLLLWPVTDCDSIIVCWTGILCILYSMYSIDLYYYG